MIPRPAAADLGGHDACDERSIDEELAFHLDLLRDDLRAAGRDEEAVEAEVLRRFGDPRSVRARCIAISKGATVMWMRISVGLNVLFALVLVLGGVGYLRYAAAARDQMMAARAAQSAALEKLGDSLRKDLWATDQGMVQVVGLVARPGEYPTSMDAPRTLAQLVADAGGTLPAAREIVVRRLKNHTESTRPIETLAGAQTAPTDIAPGPGDVVLIR